MSVWKILFVMNVKKTIYFQMKDIYAQNDIKKVLEILVLKGVAAKLFPIATHVPSLGRIL